MLQKRRLGDDYLPLTPHASSSTQHAPSSPTRAYEKVLPSRQYARPTFSGEWFSMGRSSAVNDLALPSNNRLVSRTHCKLRYIAHENTFEIKCVGFNGLSLRIADQKMYVKRNTGIMVQLHEECDLELNIAGSLVEIERPTKDAAPAIVLPMPSSPVLPLEADPLEKPTAEGHDYQDLVLFQPLSPLASPTGMMTPSVTPDAKRVRLTSSMSPTSVSSEGAVAAPLTSSNALQPRLLTFKDNVQRFSQNPSCSHGNQNPGKENIPPDFLDIESQAISASMLNSDADADAECIAVAADPMPLEIVSEAKVTAAATLEQAQCRANDEETGIQQEAFDLKQIDQEFIDMLLTVLATSVISPAPLSVILPFFPVETKSSDIESLLRSQPCVTEHVMTNNFSDHQTSTWSYDASKDTDALRMTRLSSMQKPQRSLRPRTYQQMHTYEYEHSKYVMDCKAAGIKPVRFDGTRYRRTHASQSLM